MQGHLKEHRGVPARILDAIYYNDIAKVKRYLLSGGTTRHHYGTHGPLHYVTTADMVELLVQYKADVNHKGDRQIRPLHRACIFGMSDVIKALLTHGAQVNNDCCGYTPLHCVHNAKAAELLIEHGANPNIVDQYGFTPLETTVNDTRLFEYLLGVTRVTDIVGENGRTLLHTNILDYPDITEKILKKAMSELK